MSATPETEIEYYFVPLGRERGGYLDLLKLPPDADVNTVSRKHREHLNSLDEEFKEKRRLLQEKLEQKKITQKEFDDKVKALKGVRTERESELNKLEGKYGTIQAEQREAAREHRRDDSTGWVEIYAGSRSGCDTFGDRYLDLLGLLPDADVNTVSRKHREHLNSLDEEFKEKRRLLRKELKQNKITQEGFDDKVKALQDVWTERKIELNKLKNKYNKIQAEQRAAAREGQPKRWKLPTEVREHFWDRLLEGRVLPQVDPERVAAIEDRWNGEDQQHFPLTPTRPGVCFSDALADLPYLTREEIRQRQQWFKKAQQDDAERLRRELDAKVEQGEVTRDDAAAELARRHEEAEDEARLFAKRLAEFRSAVKEEDEGRRRGRPRRRFKRLDRSGFFAAEGPKLSMLVDLVTERNLLLLLAADALWSKLRYTNRDNWREQITAWTKEISQLGPHLRQQSSSALPSNEECEYPGLCQPPDRSVGKLEARELGEIASEPDRKGAVSGHLDPVLAALMRAVLEAESGMRPAARATTDAESDPFEAAEESKESPEGAFQGKPVPDELRALLEKMARIREPPEVE